MGAIRFLLAFSVLLLHTAPDSPNLMVGGRVAVETFFIISGFYMALILNEKYASFHVFFTNRMLLLFPSYLAVFVATLCWMSGVQWFTGTSAGELAEWAKHGPQMNAASLAYLVFTQIVIFGQDLAMFLAFDPARHSLHFVSNFLAAPLPAYRFLLIPQAWSIGLELIFYLVAPFVVTRKIRWMLGLIAASLGLRYVLIYSFGLSFDPWNYRFFPNELAWFLLGSCAYRAYRSFGQIAVAKIGRRVTWALWGLTIGLILTLLKLPIPARIPLFYAYFVIALPFLFDLTKKSSIDRYIGHLSYPMYLTHWLVLSVLATFQIQHNVPLTALLTVAASVVLLHLVQVPIDTYRQRLAAANKIPTGQRAHRPVPESLVSAHSPAILS